MKWITRCNIDGKFPMPFCQCLLFYLLTCKDTHSPCLFSGDLSHNKCPTLTVGWSGRCLELWTLFTAESQPGALSSQKPAPSDTKPLTCSCLLGRRLPEFLKPDLGRWCPKVLPDTMLQLASLSLGNTGSVLWMLPLLKSLSVWDMLKGKNILLL